MRFVGGTVTYTEYRSPVQAVTAMTAHLFQGHRSTITDGGLGRDAGGLLCADIHVAAYFSGLDQLNQMFGMDRFTFVSAEELVSTSVDCPAIFQNFASAFVPCGMQFTLHGQTITTPFGFRWSLTLRRLASLSVKSCAGHSRFDTK
jgi:hypothetical protein